MQFDDELLNQIFEKTDGHCYHCGKKLAWQNYGNSNGKGGWEVDHSIPVSKGGTDHLNNLFPSCVPCNRSKTTLTSRQYKRTMETSSNNSKEDPWAALLLAGGLLLGAIIINRLKQKREIY